jgi:hypothetical protein
MNKKIWTLAATAAFAANAFAQLTDTEQRERARRKMQSIVSTSNLTRP